MSQILRTKEIYNTKMSKLKKPKKNRGCIYIKIRLVRKNGEKENKIK